MSHDYFQVGKDTFKYQNTCSIAASGVETSFHTGHCLLNVEISGILNCI